MPPKIDPDATPGIKLLRIFQKLMLDGRRHYQTDLAEEFQCSAQTIIRNIAEIESVVGISLETGLDNRRRWYQIRTITRSRLGLEFEELRYLSICRDLAAASLPKQVAERVDRTLFELSVLMADHAYAAREKVQKPQLAFYSKGRIDYTPYYAFLDKLTKAKEEQLVCLVRYKAVGRKAPREHKFVPGRFVSMSNTLYVTGACLTDDFSSVKHIFSLAVHRIHDVILTERLFHFELPEYSPEAFGLPWHEPRPFTISFAPGKAAEYVRERIWSDNQKMTDLKNGGLLLEITTQSEPELMAWVRSFGEEANLQTSISP